MQRITSWNKIHVILQNDYVHEIATIFTTLENSIKAKAIYNTSTLILKQLYIYTPKKGVKPKPLLHELNLI